MPRTILFFAALIVLAYSCTEKQSPLFGKWNYAYSKSEIKLKNDTAFQPLDSAISIFNDDLKSFDFINSNEVMIYYHDTIPTHTNNGHTVSIPAGLGKYTTWKNKIRISFSMQEISMVYEIKDDTLILYKTLVEPNEIAALINKTNKDISEIDKLQSITFFSKDK